MSTQNEKVMAVGCSGLKMPVRWSGLIISFRSSVYCWFLVLILCNKRGIKISSCDWGYLCSFIWFCFLLHDFETINLMHTYHATYLFNVPLYSCNTTHWNLLWEIIKPHCFPVLIVYVVISFPTFYIQLTCHHPHRILSHSVPNDIFAICRVLG